MHGSQRRMSIVARAARTRSHQSAVSSFTSSAIGPIRSVVDAAGTFWQVCEVEFALDRRSWRSLVFESEGSVRRVRNYPNAWHELADEELAELVETT